MSLPKEPRQKMVNLMYLVLTAMLALNVSAEILNAFKTIGESIERSNVTLLSENIAAFSQIQRKLQDKPSIAPIAEKASKLRAMTDREIASIDEMLTELLTRAKYDPATGEYENSNLDIPTKYLLGEGRATKMREDLTAYVKNIEALISPKEFEELKPNIALDFSPRKKGKTAVSNSPKDWEYSYFHMTPVVAAWAILCKFKNDLMTTEATFLEHFMQQIGEDVIVYDRLEPFVSAVSDYILLGNKYEASIGIGALSSTVKPIIKVNGVPVSVSGGIGKYTETPSAVGERKLNVEVSMKKADGSMETTHKVVSYSVGASAGVSVSPDGMNLFYIGIDNPVTVIGSVGDEKLKTTISQGSMTRVKPGKYTVRVSQPGDCYVTVQEEGKPGVKFPFRVKTIPDPVLAVGSLKPGTVSAATFRSQTGLLAVLENFEFDAYFKIESYKMLLSGAGFPDIFQAQVTGSAFNSEIESILTKIKKGTIVTFIDVYVVGPDKKQRRLPSVSYMIK